MAMVALLATGVGFEARSLGALGWLQRDSVDARFSLRGRLHEPRDVTVVGIDNNSLGELPRYPFTRRLHARLLERLHAAGARLIVYDISFDRPTSAGADLALFEAARTSAPVVFATSLISPLGRTQVLGGDANLASIGDSAAAADLVPDADGVLRHTTETVSGLPTIAAAVRKLLTHTRSADKLLDGGWIDFPGPSGTILNLSFGQVLAGRFPANAVKGRVVVVGATAPVLQDTHATSAGSPMSGPEVQAASIATALAGFPLRDPSGLVAALLIIALSCAVPLTGIRAGALISGLAGLALLAAWCCAVMVSFDAGTVLDFADPLGGLLAATVGTAILSGVEDNRDRRRLRAMFAAGEREVVEGVLHHPGEIGLEPTGVIAGYRLERILGRGGMGVVYGAVQLDLDRPVAIKVIASDHAQDPAFRARFRSECRIAAAIEHPHVIPVYEAGEDESLLFIAMRLVDGCDLDQLLRHIGPLAGERALKLIAQLGGALDAAHARGLVHRDVKPANVLLTSDEPQHVYLTDFGLARELRATRITRGELIGTLDYLSPEQIRGEHTGGASDIYALTGVLFSCLTARVPFPSDTAAAGMWSHLSAAPPSVTEHRPELLPEVDEVIARGMAKAPDERYATAAELAREFAKSIGVALPTAAPSEKLPPEPRRAPARGTPTAVSK